MSKLLSTLASWFSFIRKMTPSGLSPKEDMRQLLAKYSGGKINMTRNEETGVAFIEIDHREKRNALSGKSATFPRSF